MRPHQIGQVVKFKNPVSTEEELAVFQVKEIFLDVEKPRVIVKALNQGGSLSSTHTYLVEELEVVNNSFVVG